MLPVVAIIIAYGIHAAIELVKSLHLKLVLPVTIIIVLAIAFNFSKSWHQYVVHQQLHQPWHRQYGYEHLITYLNNLENADSFHITNREGEPYIFVLFYNRIEPRVYQDWPQKRLAHVDIAQGADRWNMFEYTFYEEPCTHDPEDTNPNNIYVSSYTCGSLPKTYKRLETITFMDGEPEFYVDRPMSEEERAELEMKEILQL
jgi:hypothetical protein